MILHLPVISVVRGFRGQIQQGCKFGVFFLRIGPEIFHLFTGLLDLLRTHLRSPEIDPFLQGFLYLLCDRDYFLVSCIPFEFIHHRKLLQFTGDIETQSPCFRNRLSYDGQIRFHGLELPIPDHLSQHGVCLIDKVLGILELVILHMDLGIGGQCFHRDNIKTHFFRSLHQCLGLCQCRICTFPLMFGLCLAEHLTHLAAQLFGVLISGLVDKPVGIGDIHLHGAYVNSYCDALADDHLDLLDEIERLIFVIFLSYGHEFIFSLVGSFLGSDEFFILEK